MQVRDKNYLMPGDVEYDAKLQVCIQAVDLGLATSAMENAKSRINFITLATCRNNPFERSIRGSAHRLASNRCVPFCSGHTDLKLDESCEVGHGAVVMPENFLAFSTRGHLTVKRVR